MQIPGVSSLVFLAYLLLFLPWLALRSARHIRDSKGEAAKPLPSRTAIWTGTLLSLTWLFVLAWLTGKGFGYRIFDVPALGVRAILAALLALALYFALRAVARALRSEAERRKMTVFLIAPRTAQERVLWLLVVLAASVAEEAAYRGVGMQILWYALGNPWAAALVCSVAFAAAHWTQGLKSGAVIFAMALVMHGLVAFTGTLVLAMVVHAVYDFVAGFLINRQAARYDREKAASGSVA